MKFVVLWLVGVFLSNCSFEVLSSLDQEVEIYNNNKGVRIAINILVIVCTTLFAGLPVGYLLSGIENNPAFLIFAIVGLSPIHILLFLFGYIYTGIGCLTHNIEDKWLNWCYFLTCIISTIIWRNYFLN